MKEVKTMNVFSQSLLPPFSQYHQLLTLRLVQLTTLENLYYQQLELLWIEETVVLGACWYLVRRSSFVSSSLLLSLPSQIWPWLAWRSTLSSECGANGLYESFFSSNSICYQFTLGFVAFVKGVNCLVSELGEHLSSKPLLHMSWVWCNTSVCLLLAMTL